MPTKPGFALAVTWTLVEKPTPRPPTSHDSSPPEWPQVGSPGVDETNVALPGSVSLSNRSVLVDGPRLETLTVQVTLP